jgi:peptidoglycan/xylan/chitin deacetylase (PgdA/CDA1 family)
MSPSWNWDFEDEPASSRRRLRRTIAPVAPRGGAAAPPQPPGPSRAVRVRRRRVGAGAVLLLAVILTLALSGGSGGHSPRPARHAAALTAPAQARPPLSTQASERAAVASVLGYTPFVKEGGSRVPDVALTFDDGPGPYTPEVLSVLERFHVRATFFTIGRMERYFSVSTARELRDGDVIGNHTETHPMMAQLSARDQREQLQELAYRIEFLGGRPPDLFRPPYGSFDATTFKLLHQMHMLMVLWSVDTNDYRLPGTEAIVQRALAGAQPGAIILLHDGGGDRAQTIAALPAIIRGLRARHLRIVTVPQLLADDPPPAGQPLPSSLAGD